ncbi:hypothetical protein ILYODFUR_007559 [Ilyodon furcidens]|uniref:THAP-type domain-containing protein n=1 Tax=Ilyodon furcidens TaxID=33524 RepID=A0ABV0VBY7_9TELE
MSKAGRDILQKICSCNCSERWFYKVFPKGDEKKCKPHFSDFYLGYKDKARHWMLNCRKPLPSDRDRRPGTNRDRTTRNEMVFIKCQNTSWNPAAVQLVHRLPAMILTPSPRLKIQGFKNSSNTKLEARVDSF